MRKRYTFLIGAIITVALIYGGLKIRTWIKGPKKNSHPQYYVTVSGNIDPDLSKPIYLGFWAIYNGYNKKCVIPAKFYETGGLDHYPAKTIFYRAKPNKNGDYTVKIPIDYYLPGKCDWKISQIRFIVENNIISKDIDATPHGTSTVMQFIQSAPRKPEHKKYIQYGCNDEMSICLGDQLDSERVSSVSRTKNYHFIQDYRRTEPKK